MSSKSIKPFYDSKEWKNVRKLKMLEANYRCEKCGNVAEEVHHIIVLSESNLTNPMIALNMKNLIALCKDCHNKEHGRFKKTNIKFDANGNLKSF